MTLTEFNQNPSRASRLAELGEVRVTRRGRPFLKLLRDESLEVSNPSATARVEQMISEGRLTAPRQTSGAVHFTDYETDPGLGATALAQFEVERDAFHY